MPLICIYVTFHLKLIKQHYYNAYINFKNITRERRTMSEIDDKDEELIIIDRIELIQLTGLHFFPGPGLPRVY
jgi:hypothetical protein